MDRGIVYVAFGDAYIQEATSAARSALKFNPDIPICLLSDGHGDPETFDVSRDATPHNPIIRGKLE